MPFAKTLRAPVRALPVALLSVAHGVMGGHRWWGRTAYFPFAAGEGRRGDSCALWMQSRGEQGGGRTAGVRVPQDAGDDAHSYHLPVLSAEVAQYLQPAPGKVILDATLGGGGHSELLLQAGAHV